MKWLSGLLLALILAGCGNAPAELTRSDRCVAAFKSYDQARSLDLKSVFDDLSAGGPTVRDEEQLLTAEAAIKVNDCRYNSAQIPGLVTPRSGMKLNRAGDSGAFGKTKYMHVAITTDRNGARNLEQFFAGLGYSVRVSQADRLGWRVFLGPLKSNGAVLAAETLMEQIGLETAYIVN